MSNPFKDGQSSRRLGQTYRNFMWKHIWTCVVSYIDFRMDVDSKYCQSSKEEMFNFGQEPTFQNTLRLEIIQQCICLINVTSLQ